MRTVWGSRFRTPRLKIICKRKNNGGADSLRGREGATEEDNCWRYASVEVEACYLVKWKGYPMEEATWQPLENIGHLHKDLQMLEPRTREKKRRPRKTKKIRDVQGGGAPSSGSRTQKGSIADFQEHQESSEKISSCVRAFRAGTRADEENYPVKVLEKLRNARSEVTFRLRKEDEIFALTDKQTKLLFPAELSLFYEEEFKQSIRHVAM